MQGYRGCGDRTPIVKKHMEKRMSIEIDTADCGVA